MRALIGFLAAALCILSGERAYGATLFGLVDTGELFASSDAGVTWSIRSSLPVRDAVAIAAGASASEVFLGGSHGVIYRSSDAGMSWNAVGAVAAGDVVDLIVAPDLSIVVLTASGALYRSIDHGATFLGAGTLTAAGFTSLAIGNYGEKLDALTRSGETWESVDGGDSWTAKGALPVSDAIRLRGVGGALVLLTSTGDVYSSTDGGTTWLAVGTLSQVGMTSLVNDGETLIAAAGTGEIATSIDGAAWAWRGAIEQMTVRSLGIDTPAAGSVEETGAGGGLSASAPWPNPVARGGAVFIDLRLPKASTIEAALIDPGGRVSSRRAIETIPAGDHRLRWDLGDHPAGVYWIRLRGGDGMRGERKVVVAR
jgi:hypothetical protein